MSEMPFGFTWCYEETEDDNEQCLVLVIGEPEDVPPLDIDISNILSDKTIAIKPMDGVDQPDANNYHFKLAFVPGILAYPSAIAVESADWSVSSVSNENEDSIYLLWTGAETSLSPQDEMKVILTGVAAQSVEISTTATEVGATTTDVTISWEFDQGGIEVMSLGTRIPVPDDYDKNTTLTLTMVQSTGKSNIPLYVGFVNCNKVLNTYDEASSLQLRLTNTNLPSAANPDITFQYDAQGNQPSQLVVTLEVGKKDDVPWALGTEDQVNDIKISIAGDQWSQNGDIETIEVDGVVQALQWTFIPQDADVVLKARKTMLINLDNIITAHPTGEANLYLSYRYVPGYKDGQFVCQIEKAPLTFDEKVRVGTRLDSECLLNVKNGISLDCSGSAIGDIQNVGTLAFRSDTDGTEEDDCAHFYRQSETDPLMRLDKDGKLHFRSNSMQKLNLYYELFGIGIQSNTIYFRTNQHFAWYEGGSHSDDTFDPGEDGKVSMVLKNDQLGGTDSPSVVLDVKGRIKDQTGYVVPVGTVVPYAGTSAPEGWLMCDGQKFEQSDYPELHDVLNSDTVPDLRNRFITGAGGNYKLNEIGGKDTVPLTVKEMPTHNHAPNDTYKYVLKVDDHYTIGDHNDTKDEPHLQSAQALEDRGGGDPHENRPPYYALNYIIKA